MTDSEGAAAGGTHASPAQKAAALKRTLLFAALTDPELERLAALAQPVSYAMGVTIFDQGDAPNGLYVIEHGRVKIATSSAAGRELVLNILGPGTVFGEIALLDGGVRTAGAIACEPARLLLIPTRPLIAFLEGSPEVMRRMLVTLAGRLRWVSGQVEDMMFLSLPARLAKRLLMLGNEFGVDTERGRRLTVVLPQHELASHLNVARETVNRLMQDWRELGLIEVHRGFIVLTDIGRLTEIEETG